MAYALAGSRAGPSSRQAFTAFQGMRACRPVVASNATQSVASRAAAGRKGLTVFARAPEAGIGIMGTKAGMTTIFKPDGQAVPATVIALEEGNVVTQILTKENNGYAAVQVGYKRVPEKRIKKPELGHCNKAEVPPMRHLREFKPVDPSKVEEYKVGQELDVEEMFPVGELVDVAGTSIGKGFQGGIKRHRMHRGPMTHGSKSHRELGGIGSSATPARVFPGQKMPGQMGAERVKVRKLEVLLVDKERAAIVVKGGVPGKAGNILEITPAKVVGKNC